MVHWIDRDRSTTGLSSIGTKCGDADAPYVVVTSIPQPGSSERHPLPPIEIPPVPADQSTGRVCCQRTAQASDMTPIMTTMMIRAAEAHPAMLCSMLTAAPSGHGSKPQLHGFPRHTEDFDALRSTTLPHRISAVFRPGCEGGLNCSELALRRPRTAHLILRVAEGPALPLVLHEDLQALRFNRYGAARRLVPAHRPSSVGAEARPVACSWIRQRTRTVLSRRVHAWQGVHGRGQPR